MAVPNGHMMGQRYKLVEIGKAGWKTQESGIDEGGTCAEQNC